MEKLDRGLVAVQQSDGKVFLSWRLLASDPAGVAFNVYRETDRPAATADPGRFPASSQTAQTGPVRVNLTAPHGRNVAARLGRPPRSGDSLFRRRSGEGVEQPGRKYRFMPTRPRCPISRFPCRPRPATRRTTPPSAISTATASTRSSCTDRRGEGQLAGRHHRRADLQAYKLDGTLLWRINLGRNIREGAHYTQFMVYDLDGDGRAEVVCKTADGTVDGAGKVIGDAKADWRHAESAGETSRLGDRAAPRRHERLRLHPAGPEFLTVFDGLTGAALATATYLPRRHPDDRQPDAEQWATGASLRQPRRPLPRLRRLSRRRAAERRHVPRLLHARRARRLGLGEAAQAHRRWVFDSDIGRRTSAYRGQGNHHLSVADVDGDGRDEIIYGAAVDRRRRQGALLHRAGPRRRAARHRPRSRPVPGSRCSTSRSASARRA